MYKAFLLLFVSVICLPIFAQKDIFDIARTGTLLEVRDINTFDPNAINSKNKDGYSPLILACYRGNIAVAKFLAENSTTINELSNMGTALMAATYKGQTEIVKILLENKANPNLADQNGATPLIYCAMFGNKDIIKLLLDYKADKTHKDKEGKTSFEFAVFAGNQEIIRLLEN